MPKLTEYHAAEVAKVRERATKLRRYLQVNPDCEPAKLVALATREVKIITELKHVSIRELLAEVFVPGSFE